jgi:hypothetical protein
MSETVRARVVIVVDSSGCWEGIGGSQCSDELATEIANSDLNENSSAPPGAMRRVVYMEADISLPVRPEPQTVEGEVSDAD